MAICKTVTQENNLLLQRMRCLQDFANNFSSISTLSCVESNSIYVVFDYNTSLKLSKMKQQRDNNDRKLLQGTSGARNSAVPAISVLKPGKHVLLPITRSFHPAQYVDHCSCSSISRSDGLSNLHKPGRNQQASPHPP